MRQSKANYRRIRREDILIDHKNLENYSEEEINQMCICRGIEFDKKTLNEKHKDLKLWIVLSNLRNVPNSLLL